MLKFDNSVSNSNHKLMLEVSYHTPPNIRCVNVQIKLIIILFERTGNKIKCVLFWFWFLGSNPSRSREANAWQHHRHDRMVLMFNQNISFPQGSSLCSHVFIFLTIKYCVCVVISILAWWLSLVHCTELECQRDAFIENDSSEFWMNLMNALASV